MGREVGGMFKREGTNVYLWLIHVDVWEKPTKFCKSIMFQLKNKSIFKKFLKRKFLPTPNVKEQN